MQEEFSNHLEHIDYMLDFTTSENRLIFYNLSLIIKEKDGRQEGKSRVQQTTESHIHYKNILERRTMDHPSRKKMQRMKIQAIFNRGKNLAANVQSLQ